MFQWIIKPTSSSHDEMLWNIKSFVFYSILFFSIKWFFNFQILIVFRNNTSSCLSCSSLFFCWPRQTSWSQVCDGHWSVGTSNQKKRGKISVFNIQIEFICNCVVFQFMFSVCLFLYNFFASLLKLWAVNINTSSRRSSNFELFAAVIKLSKNPFTEETLTYFWQVFEGWKWPH